MQLTPSYMASLFTGFQGHYNRGLALADQTWKKFADVIPSSAAIEEYPVLMAGGQMREWIGDRQVNELDGLKITVRNISFERTISVDRQNLEDDRIGYYGTLFQTEGVAAGNLWPKLATEALTMPATWADGAPFFGSRRFYKATINNLIEANLSLEQYLVARARMMQFRDAGGNPLGLIPNVLMVGATQEAAARTILEAALVAEEGVAVTNVWAKSAELVINPFLVGDYASDWYLCCTNRGMMPVVVQQRKNGVMTRMDREDQTIVFKTGKNHYGITSRGAAIAGLPHLVIRGRAGA